MPGACLPAAVSYVAGRSHTFTVAPAPESVTWDDREEPKRTKTTTSPTNTTHSRERARARSGAANLLTLRDATAELNPMHFLPSTILRPNWLRRKSHSRSVKRKNTVSAEHECRCYTTGVNEEVSIFSARGLAYLSIWSNCSTLVSKTAPFQLIALGLPEGAWGGGGVRRRLLKRGPGALSQPHDGLGMPQLVGRQLSPRMIAPAS